jgi:hypothetical protein
MPLFRRESFLHAFSEKRFLFLKTAVNKAGIKVYLDDTAIFSDCFYCHLLNCAGAAQGCTPNCAKQ